MAKSKASTAETEMKSTTETTDSVKSETEGVGPRSESWVGTQPEAVAGNKPVAVFRARGVKVAVFANGSDSGTFHKATIQRVYRQGEEFKTTTSLGRDDLLIAQHLITKAVDFILQAESRANVQ